MNKRKEARKNSLLPNGIPKKIRCYDNGGESFDRYTVVFTGNYTSRTNGQHWHYGMSSNPFHPQGFGQHGSTDRQIDYPTYGHLGKKITWDLLPENCKKLIIQTYLYLWDFTDEDGNEIK